MPVSPARAAAFDILIQVEQEDAYASDLLHSARFQKLSSADHGLATELVMGVLRWRSLLDERIAQHASRSLDKLDLEVLIALRLAAYQLLFLGRVPAHAAVDESVELVKRARKRSAVPMANAVLRKLAPVLAQQREHIFPLLSDSPPGSPEPLAAGQAPERLCRCFAHPLWLVERWVNQFGGEAAQRICNYDQRVPETAIRLSEPAAETELEQAGVKLAPGQLLARARRVLLGDVSNTRAFREGRIAIQDEASQLVALLVGKGTSILDCCAAPGGKTRMLAERNPGATIVAAELHPHRALLLRKLVHAETVQVIAADARGLPVSARFDRVLADVPCSGTGTLARNPEIKWRLKPDDLADLQSRQTAILQSAMQHVTPGGRLVYSTCSLEREENEEVVAKALASDCSFRLLECRPELEQLRSEGELAWKDLDSLTSGPYLRTIPGVHPGEGFFAATLQKT
ncbi:MAG: 16S rRNA (cytosine(967)-C(5))-methyltransferase RsmB [Acidobacteriia bacterium]|nr:16S rRNA (cytosine(967)-C(5))-methyltransferase RsmB [Terriglobia bacterium]